MCASKEAGSIVRSSGFTSQNTTVAPMFTAPEQLAHIVMDGQITSSPGFSPIA